MHRSFGALLAVRGVQRNSKGEGGEYCEILKKTPKRGGAKDRLYLSREWTQGRYVINIYFKGDMVCALNI